MNDKMDDSLLSVFVTENKTQRMRSIKATCDALAVIELQVLAHPASQWRAGKCIFAGELKFCLPLR